MPVVATLLERRPALVALRRAIGSSSLRALAARSPAHLDSLLSQHQIDAVIISATPARGQVLDALRRQYATLPVMLYAPLRSDDADLLLRLQRERIVGVAVEGVDEPIMARQILGHGITARRLEALRPLASALNLEDPLQQQAWELVISEAPAGITTARIAALLKVTRETLSRRFGAGGAPSLKRAMDAVRLYAASRLLANAAYRVDDVARLMGFSSASLLQRTARRTFGVTAREMGAIGDEEWVRGVRGEGGDWE